MQNTNRKIEDFIDEKLRSSRVTKTTGDFSAMLMKRIALEHKSAAEESKWDKLVKYIIGGFSASVIGLTLVLGFISGSSAGSNQPSNGINLSPAMETSNNYLDRFLVLIQSVFVSILNFFGLSINIKTFAIIIIVVLAAAVFLLAEKFILRGRLRSSGAGIK